MVGKFSAKNLHCFKYKFNFAERIRRKDEVFVNKLFMKKLVLAILIAGVGLVFMGCGQKTVIENSDFLVKRGDVYVFTHTLKPFTGKLVEGGSVATFKKGLLHGKSMTPTEVRNYRNGLLHGKAWTFYTNGEIRKMEEFRDGLLHGRVQTFHASGSLANYGVFRNGIPHGQHRTFHDNDSNTIATLITFRDGVLEGRTEEYFVCGTLRFIATYRNGYLDGAQEIWWGENNPRILTTYATGKINGRFEQFDVEGNLVLSAMFNDGIPNGLWEQFYESGYLALRGDFNMGQRNGRWEEFWDFRAATTAQQPQQAATQQTAAASAAQQAPTQRICRGDDVFETLLFPRNRTNLNTALAEERSVAREDEASAEEIEAPSREFLPSFVKVENHRQASFRRIDPNAPQPQRQIAKPRTVWNFQNGTLNGEVRIFNEEGTLIGVENYSAGLCHGKFEEFNAEGNSIAEFGYTNGVANEERARARNQVRRAPPVQPRRSPQVLSSAVQAQVVREYGARFNVSPGVIRNLSLSRIGTTNRYEGTMTIRSGQFGSYTLRVNVTYDGRTTNVSWTW